jgi:hypothetical protein
MSQPEQVGFVPVHIYELVGRPGRPLTSVEPLLSGDYEKHNDNDGGIFPDNALKFVRNTPQAFSHFTFQKSGGQMVVCDIQGVEDFYTDPQIHTLAGRDYGQGNMGKKGIEKFICSHVCNDICKRLQLRPISGAPGSADAVAGGGSGFREDVLEYARYIGLDPKAEPGLMWIAQEGIDAPLPEGWGEALTADGTSYYFNKQTRQSSWDHPHDEHYRQVDRAYDGLYRTVDIA